MNTIFVYGLVSFVWFASTVLSVVAIRGARKDSDITSHDTAVLRTWGYALLGAGCLLITLHEVTGNTPLGVIGSLLCVAGGIVAAINSRRPPTKNAKSIEAARNEAAQSISTVWPPPPRLPEDDAKK